MCLQGTGRCIQAATACSARPDSLMLKAFQCWEMGKNPDPGAHQSSPCGPTSPAQKAQHSAQAHAPMRGGPTHLVKGDFMWGKEPGLQRLWLPRAEGEGRGQQGPEEDVGLADARDVCWGARSMRTCRCYYWGCYRGCVGARWGLQAAGG